tara:strand:- start:948 stop:1697 length:750 start_codon:yes stop_codon:yes gene_type:complete
MLKKRIIPIVQLMENSVVKTVCFENPRQVGDPTATVKVFSARAVDELVLIDIGASKNFKTPDFDFISIAAKNCFMPLTIGGGISSFEHAEKIFDVGADKLLIGSMLHVAPDRVEKVASNYGSQAIVASLDCKLINGEYVTFSFSGCNKSFTLSEMISRAHDVGVGEICVTSIEHEGVMNGYSIPLLNEIIDLTSLPVIINGGAGCYEDFLEAFKKGASATAASSVFFWQGYTNNEIKKSLRHQHIPVTN